MLEYINVIKGIGEHIATSSGVVAAFDSVDGVNPPRFFLGIDINDPPKLEDGPVCIINPAPSQVDSGSGSINLGQDYNEQSPGFSVEWWFNCTTKTTTNNLTRLDGYDYCDDIGQVIINEVVDYFRQLGYELSYIDYSVLPIAEYPAFVGIAMFCIRGLRTLEADPTFN